MFDIGWDELLVIAIVALVVIGPKDLPHAFRIAGRWMRRARTMAREFQSHIDDLMQESELNELKREISDVPRPKIMDEIDSELMSGQMPKKTLVTEPVKAPAAPVAVNGVPADSAPVATGVDPVAPATPAGETDPSRAA